MVCSVEIVLQMVDCGNLIILSGISVLVLLNFSSIDDLLDDLLNSHNVELFFSLMV
jgi:hypothetical protein